MEKIITGILVILFGGLVAVATAAALSLLFGWLFQFLWNYVAQVYWPGAPQLTFLQAVATVTLLVILRGPGMPTNWKKK